jgi:hypothetical protein
LLLLLSVCLYCFVYFGFWTVVESEDAGAFSSDAVTSSLTLESAFYFSSVASCSVSVFTSDVYLDFIVSSVLTDSLISSTLDCSLDGTLALTSVLAGSLTSLSSISIIENACGL